MNLEQDLEYYKSNKNRSTINFYFKFNEDFEEENSNLSKVITNV